MTGAPSLAARQRIARYVLQLSTYNVRQCQQACAGILMTLGEEDFDLRWLADCVLAGGCAPPVANDQDDAAETALDGVPDSDAALISMLIGAAQHRHLVFGREAQFIYGARDFYGRRGSISPRQQEVLFDILEKARARRRVRHMRGET